MRSAFILALVLLAGCTPLRLTTETRACLGLCVWSETGAQSPPLDGCVKGP
jgi:hypothetical protein